METGVDDEITAVRLSIRRALLKLEGEMDPIEYGRLTRLIFSGANTIGYLMRTRRMITDEAADSIANSIAQILQEFKDEKGWEI